MNSLTQGLKITLTLTPLACKIIFWSSIVLGLVVLHDGIIILRNFFRIRRARKALLAELAKERESW